MVAKTKKYLITSEKHEIFIVRRGQHTAIHGFCPECKTEVEMLTFDSAVSFAQKQTRELFELIERGAIHSVETTTGHLLVCKSSLAKEKQ